MSFRPTLFSAALAGLVAAVVWPFIWARWGGPGADGSVELVVGTLAAVVLPAHALVVGFGRAPTGGVDTALLKRVGAWLVSAACATAARAVLGL